MTEDDRALSIDVNEVADGIVVVQLAGELDLATAPELVDRLAVVRSRSASRIVVDVSRLTFVDSSGLNALVAAARPANGRLVVAAPSPHLARVLDIVRLGEVVEIEPTVEAALRSAGATDATDGEAA